MSCPAEGPATVGKGDVTSGRPAVANQRGTVAGQGELGDVVGTAARSAITKESMQKIIGSKGSGYSTSLKEGATKVVRACSTLIGGATDNKRILA